jgi:formylglycine-generating enzyme required for sulfatase activity
MRFFNSNGGDKEGGEFIVICTQNGYQSHQPAAVEFCNKLSEQEGLTPVYSLSRRNLATGYPITGMTVSANLDNNGCRLPTGAEWEYAAKGGDGSPGNYIYSGSDNIDSVGQCIVNSGNTTHAPGTKAPNGLGIYDLSGNVWEWRWDWYNDSIYYGSSPSFHR